MIIQTAPKGAPHFVITQIDHARASGQLAAAFGNDQFAEPLARDLLVYIVTHHDEGWRDLDDRWLINPQTGLPYHLTHTPILELIKTGSASPDFNEKHHPYCGLLSSMHTWGLYHGRYGLSDKIFIDSFPTEHRPSVDQMLAGEQARQTRIKALLGAHPDTSPWVTEQALFANYKLLQFFDTLALYLQTTHASERGESQFLRVPLSLEADTTVTIRPVGDDSYQLTPYPFRESEIVVTTRGRYVASGTSAEAAATLPYTEQSARLVP